jgi:Mce-associated membrane protein
MPPPRRRRPVQPATRVRLPRTARPASPSATAALAGQTTTDEPDDLLTEPDLAETDPAEPDPAETDLTDSGVAANGLAAGESSGKADTADDEDLADGSADDEDLADADEDDDQDDEPAQAPADQAEGGTARRRLLLPACLAGVAVVLGGLAVWFAVEAGNTGSGVNEQNTALLDSAATTKVNKQIDAAVNTVFSYNYADTARTKAAAQSLLTGKAIAEYNSLFKLVAQDAPSEKLVLTTTVTNSGVSMLTGNRAQVLIFANQQDTGGSTRSTTDAGAMFSVDAVYQGGGWKIDNIDTFSAGS